MQREKNLHRQDRIYHSAVSSRCHLHIQGLCNLPQVITWQGGKQDGRQLECIYERIVMHESAPAQKTHVEWDTVAHNRIVAKKLLQWPGNRLKVGSICYLLGSDSG